MLVNNIPSLESRPFDSIPEFALWAIVARFASADKALYKVALERRYGTLTQ